MSNYWSSVTIFHTLLKLQNKSGCKRTEDSLFHFSKTAMAICIKTSCGMGQKQKQTKHTKSLHDF